MKHPIAITALLVATTASAQSWTGNELLERLQSTEQGPRMAAFGYVRGIADALTGDLICPPDGVTYGQAFDVVTNWLIVNAAERHRKAGTLTIIALGTTWPCKQQPTKKGAGA